MCFSRYCACMQWVEIWKGTMESTIKEGANRHLSRIHAIPVHWLGWNFLRVASVDSLPSWPLCVGLRCAFLFPNKNSIFSKTLLSIAYKLHSTYQSSSQRRTVHSLFLLSAWTIFSVGNFFSHFFFFVQNLYHFESEISLLFLWSSVILHFQRNRKSKKNWPFIKRNCGKKKYIMKGFLFIFVFF